MENIMHPQACIDIRQIFDKLPHDVKLAFPVYKSKEVTSDFLFLPKRKMRLNQAPEGPMQPFRIDKRTIELPKIFHISFRMAVIPIKMEGQNIRTVSYTHLDEKNSSHYVYKRGASEMRKTKIICTLGPATDNEKTLRELMLAGMAVSYTHLDVYKRQVENLNPTV